METIGTVFGGQPGWPWYQVMADLKEKGGLDDVIIDPLSVRKNGCGGKTKKGTKFHITWVQNTFLLVTMFQNETELIEAFSRVVEYKPFCQYKGEYSKENITTTLFTFEWDKINPNQRFDELQKNEKIKELQRMEGGTDVMKTFVII